MGLGFAAATFAHILSLDKSVSISISIVDLEVLCRDDRRLLLAGALPLPLPLPLRLERDVSEGVADLEGQRLGKKLSGKVP